MFLFVAVLRGGLGWEGLQTKAFRWANALRRDLDRELAWIICSESFVRNTCSETLRGETLELVHRDCTEIAQRLHRELAQKLAQRNLLRGAWELAHRTFAEKLKDTCLENLRMTRRDLLRELEASSKNFDFSM